MIFPFSENWPTNHDFSLFSKLPTNYTKISEKIQKAYANAPQSGAFWCVNCIFSEISMQFVGNFENSEKSFVGQFSENGQVTCIPIIRSLKLY